MLQRAEQLQDLRLDHHVERGRGLVGDDQRRAARERHGDHHALLLTAGKLVRVVLDAARRQAHLFEQRAGAHDGLLLGGHAVHRDRLGDLIADPLHRVERVQRPLEHDRGSRPPDGAQLARCQRQDVLAVELELALDLRLLGMQPQDRAGDRRLAAAGFAGQTEHLALLDREVHAANRRDVAALGLVGDAQVFDGQDAHRSRILGLRISSIANPTIVNASTTSTMHRLGAISHHQACSESAPA